MVLRDWCNGSWTYGNVSSLYKELGGAEGDGETWADWRAAAWSSIPESDDTTVGAASRIGKAGAGDRRGWPYHPNDYWFRVDAFLTFDLAIDLSGLADARHADGTACAPTRLLIYWRHKCAATVGEGVTRDTCNYEVQLPATAAPTGPPSAPTPRRRTMTGNQRRSPSTPRTTPNSGPPTSSSDSMPPTTRTMTPASGTIPAPAKHRRMTKPPPSTGSPSWSSSTGNTRRRPQVPPLRVRIVIADAREKEYTLVVLHT